MWRETATIYRKEVRAYLTSPMPYVFMALFAGFMAWRFFFDEETSFFVFDKADMSRGFFFHLERYLIVLAPAVSMGQWSMETDRGTIETLLTLPIRTVSLVIAKFLAAWSLMGACLLATVPIPITVNSLGDMDWGPVLGGYFGAFLLSGGLLAFGLWVSSRSRHQIVAFVLTLLAGGLFLGMYEWAASAGSFFGPILEQLSMVTHYQEMGHGVLDLRDLAYFASVIVLFLYLNTQSVENRRYR